MNTLVRFASVLFFVMAFSANMVVAQISVTVQNPANVTPALASGYNSLADALTALNASTQITGPVVFQLAPGGTETAPVGGYLINALNGSSATNTVTITGDLGNNKPVLTAFPTQATGSRNDGVIKLIGADFISIEGIAIRENTANNVFTIGSNNSTEFGIALLYATNTNGCKNITIRHCDIQLNRLNFNSVGIYSNVRHNANTPQTIADIANTGGAHENIVIQNNSISNVALPIVVVGSTSAANMVSGVTIGGSQDSGNALSNFGNITSITAGYVSVSGTVFGVYVNNYLNVNISHNQISSANLSSAITTRGILLDYTGTPNAVMTNQVKHNRISLNNVGTLTTYRGIDINSGNNASTIDIDHNEISGCTFANAFTAINNAGVYQTLRIRNNVIKSNNQTGGSGTLSFIANSGNITTLIDISDNSFGEEGAAPVTYNIANSGQLLGITNIAGSNSTTLDVRNNHFYAPTYNAMNSGSGTLISNSAACGVQNISGNRFNNMSINSTAGFTFIALSGSVPASGSQRIRDNRIVVGFAKTGAGGTVTFISTSGSSQAGAQILFDDNIISNITLTGATSFVGITTTDGGSVNKRIINNTITNIISGNTSNIINMQNGGGAGGEGNAVRGNIIENITSAGGITAINVPSGTSNVTVAENIIRNINVSGASLSGITTTSSATGNIFKNLIFQLTSTSASASVAGIQITGGGVHNVFNNKIAGLFAPNGSGVNVVNGINASGGNASNIHYNSIYLNAASSANTFGSSALWLSVTPTTTIRNNIFVNLSTPNGTGRSVGVRRTTANLATFHNASNNNLYFCGTPSTSRVIYFDNTNADLTLDAYKARVAPRESNSISEAPHFLSLDGLDALFLKIDPNIPNNIESGAVNIAGVIDDFEGDIRQGNPGYTGADSAPDIGADEFNTIQNACSGIPIPGTIVVTPATPICNEGERTLTLSGQSNENGITFQWKFSSTPGGPYTNGGNGLIENTGLINATRYYVAEVACQTNGQSATTPEIMVQVIPFPQASFSYNQGLDNFSINFEQTGTPNASYFWNFGGGTSNLPNPSFNFGAPGNFPVTLIVSNACGADTTIQNVIVLPVSLEDISQSPFHLFPNPGQDGFWLASSISAPTQMLVADMQGKVHMSQWINNPMHWIDTNVLPKGIYIIQMRTASQSVARRWVKL